MVRQHTIVDGVNLVLTAAENLYDIIYLTGTSVLTSNWAVTFSGTPKYGETFNFRYTAKTTLAGNTISFLAASARDDWSSKDYNVTATYNGTSWDVVMMPDFDENAIVITDHLVDACVDATKLATSAVITNKIAALAVDDTKLAANSVITTKILDSNVTYAKIQDVTANSLLGEITGGAAAPQELTFAASTICARLAAGNLKACSVAEMQTLLVIQTTVLNSAQIWVGSAANLATARTLSNDVTMTNTGVVTIANDAVTRAKIASAAISIVLNTNTTQVISTGGLQIMASYTMPGNTLLANGDYLMIRTFGTTAANANAKALSLELGALVIGVNTTTGSPNNLDWMIESMVIRTADASQKVFTRIYFDGIATDNDYYLGGIDNTGNIVIRLTGTAAATDLVVEGFNVTIHRA